MARNMYVDGHIVPTCSIQFTLVVSPVDIFFIMCAFAETIRNSRPTLSKFLKFISGTEFTVFCPLDVTGLPLILDRMDLV